MDRFNVVANTVRVGLVDLADWLCGCAHRRTTYIVCRECGRHFAYDWTQMRAGELRGPALPMLLPALSEATRGSR